MSQGDDDPPISERPTLDKPTETFDSAGTLAEVTPPGTIVLGQLISRRYKIEKVLGHGGFGWVYLARDGLLDRTVALKVLLPRRLDGIGQAADDRFLREARTIAHLDHPHIVPVYDAGLLEGRPWMAMRLVRGTSLAGLLREQAPLPVLRALHYLTQAASALDHAHRHGIVHRDVKPSNLLVEKRDDGSEHVWLADFGIARVLSESTTGDALTRVVGTPSYMAPEQIASKRIDGRADLFALGCIAYELVTGARAFEGDTVSQVMYKIVHEPPPRIDELPGLASSGYAAVVRRALAKSPEDRYATAVEMQIALEAVLRSDRPPGSPSLGQRLRTWLRSPPPPAWDGRQVLEVGHLSKAYGRRVQALRDLSLAVPRGAIFGLVGSSGSGKTTLIRTALGLSRQDAGEVRLFGRDPRRDRVAVLSRVGYVPETPSVYGQLTVGETVDFLSAFYPNWDRAYAYRLLARFELPLNPRVRQLSRGLQTKVSLLAALGPRPELLLLDDPTLGLDAVMLEDFFGTLVEASEREGTTVLIASHNLDDLERIATHVGFLKSGRVLLSGALADVQGAARHVELTFPEEVPALPPLPELRTLRSSGRRLSGVVLEASPPALERLRALGPQDLAVRPLSLKELFIALMRESPPP